ncbi:MAG TPA: serine hydrolase domain-containing protein [Gemmatimonadaceae bacterium]|nr:serine hydrolase domain-containing protein [Gemmatimonadaceae bacterium]
MLARRQRALGATLAIFAASADVPAQHAAQTGGEARPALVVDSARLARFVDSLISTELSRQRIPGAAFVFVQHGRVVYARGYGLARVQPAQEVDPARTIWRVGSISKTFTATAVALLASEGRVHLGADAKHYLTKLEIPATYPLPVTVTDLLTHTAGFDEIRPGTQAATEGASCRSPSSCARDSSASGRPGTRSPTTRTASRSPAPSSRT